MRIFSIRKRFHIHVKKEFLLFAIVTLIHKILGMRMILMPYSFLSICYIVRDEDSQQLFEVNQKILNPQCLPLSFSLWNQKFVII